MLYISNTLIINVITYFYGLNTIFIFSPFIVFLGFQIGFLCPITFAKLKVFYLDIV